LFPHSKQEEKDPSSRLEFSLRSILPVPTRREGKTKANFITAAYGIDCTRDADRLDKEPYPAKHTSPATNAKVMPISIETRIDMRVALANLSLESGLAAEALVQGQVALSISDRNFGSERTKKAAAVVISSLVVLGRSNEAEVLRSRYSA
jgi:hypothetical protein